MHVRNHSKHLAGLFIGGFLLAAALFVTGCTGAAPRTIKIGLVAPFEGRYQHIGSEVIFAARLAIREFAAQDGHRDVNIELVAYDDAGNPEQAVEQARRLAIDPEVVAVVGHWRDETTQAALPIYSQAGLPLIVFSTQDIGQGDTVYNLAPSQPELEQAARQWLEAQNLTGTLRLDIPDDILTAADQFQKEGSPSEGILIGEPEWGLSQFYALTDQAAEGVYFVTGTTEAGDRQSAFWVDERTLQFVAGFQEGSLGAPPGLLSISAYEATWLAISLAIGEDIDASPLNTGQFDGNGRRINAPICLYRWEEGQRRLIEQLR